MSSSSDPTSSDIELLQRRVLELSVPLHAAIADFDEPDTCYDIAGPPGVALFERDAGNTITHDSGSPAPGLMPLLDDLRERHMQIVGNPANTDNSHLPSLLLLCIYLADHSTSDRLQLQKIATRPADIRPLDEEEGQHDPDLQPLDAALRAWTPLRAAHLPDAGIHPAILEFEFRSMRHQKYVPWEGAAGETAHVHTPS